LRRAGINFRRHRAGGHQVMAAARADLLLAG
jgi:hypothetical protein